MDGAAGRGRGSVTRSGGVTRSRGRGKVRRRYKVEGTGRGCGVTIEDEEGSARGAMG